MLCGLAFFVVLPEFSLFDFSSKQQRRGQAAGYLNYCVAVVPLNCSGGVLDPSRVLYF